MLKKIVFLLTLSLLTFFQACSQDKSKDAANEQANELLTSNEFVLTSTKNEQLVVKKQDTGFALQNADGKVVIYDVFATWCPPCKESATHLTSLKEKFKDEIVIIGITIEDGITNAELEEFKKEYNAQYTIVNSDTNRLLVNEIASALNLGQRFPIPIMALYKDGKLVKHYVGAVQEEFVESDIKIALGK